MRQRGLFGRRVRLLRERLGLSQAGFSEEYDIPLEDVADWEHGRVLPDRTIRDRIGAIEAGAAPTTGQPGR